MLDVEMHGEQDLIKELKSIADSNGKDAAIRAGYFSDKKEPSGLSVARVAEIQEKGDQLNTLNGKPAPIPQRPWIRPTFEYKRGEWVEFFLRFCKIGIDPKDALKTVADKMKADLKTALVQLREPPLREYTIEKKEEKGSIMPTKPLIDSKTMLDSTESRISYQNSEGVEQLKSA